MPQFHARQALQDGPLGRQALVGVGPGKDAKIEQFEQVEVGQQGEQQRTGGPGIQRQRDLEPVAPLDLGQAVDGPEQVFGEVPAFQQGQQVLLGQVAVFQAGPQHLRGGILKGLEQPVVTCGQG